MAVEKEKVIPVKIEDEVRHSFLDYAMSVIVSRALPDVRDGLKPVHRRILFTMYELGLTPDKPHRKSAKVVGDVLGKFHPHGDSAAYDAMVRMAQDFSMRYPLVDGHGNFGSVDGDPPAAYRYTEVRLTPLAVDMLADIDKETVNFVPNFDNTEQEPVVLPSKVPQLLMNGSAGIAVGMATNIPPHNLSELVDALTMLINDPDCDIDDLMTMIPGPDFPTGGYIRGVEGIKEAYKTGRGSITLRGRYEKETTEGGKNRILITELPYQVNKANLIENIALLAREKKIEGISDLRDESDRRGMSVVIELKRGADPDVVIKYLAKHTQLQTSFGIIMLSLEDGRPKVLNLKQMLENYLEHRKEVVTRRTQYDLRKAQERAHILEGLKIALDHIDAIIKTIRESESAEDARGALMKKFKLTQVQAQAILDMQLRRLAGLERKKIDDEYKELIKTIAHLEDLLKHPKKILHVIKDELNAMKEKYGDARRTVITEKTGEIHFEEIIPEEEMVIIMTRDGYVKRLPLASYRSQKRGGRGITGITTKTEDEVEHLLTGTTLHYVLFFTNQGLVYRLKAYEVPQTSRQAKGTAIVNLIQSDKDERVTAAITVKDFDDKHFLFMATELGTVKKTALSEFSNLPRAGKIALGLEKDDALGWVDITDGKKDIILVTENGQGIRFAEGNVRAMGRQAKGVRGMRLKKGDKVVGMSIADEGLELLVVTQKGFGKRTPLKQFRKQTRGGSGVRAIKVMKENGPVVGLKVVETDDEVMLSSKKGIVIRTKVKDISVQGRAARGVRLMRPDADDAVVVVERITEDE